MVAVWALIITGGLLLIHFSVRQDRRRWHAESARKIAKRRYARGEIGKEAYEEKRNELSYHTLQRYQADRTPGGASLKRIIVSVVFLLSALGMFAQDISLPLPGDKSGVDLLRAIQNRRVARAFVRKGIPLADLSTMLWAGLGPRGVDAVSSATTSGRTISFSGDNPYINIYVLNDKGTYRYLPDKNTLKFIGGTDMRAAVSRAAVPDAAVMLLFTADTALTPSFLKGNPALFLQMAHATAGFSAQNIALTASTLRLALIVQYTLAAAEAAKAAALGKDEVPLFIMQVGYTE